MNLDVSLDAVCQRQDPKYIKEHVWFQLERKYHNTHACGCVPQPALKYTIILHNLLKEENTEKFWELGAVGFYPLGQASLCKTKGKC